MIEIIKDGRLGYWSKSQVFLLPLTTFKKHEEFEYTSYLKWENWSIENFELIVKVEYGHKWEEFSRFNREGITEDKKIVIKEAYHYEGFTIFIVDLSPWHSDVEYFLKGKYSKMSPIAKEKIQMYNLAEDNGVPISIYACLFPTEKQKCLDNLTPLDYAIKHYVMNGPDSYKDLETAELWKKNGELCSICEIAKETLVLTECQNDLLCEQE